MVAATTAPMVTGFLLLMVGVAFGGGDDIKLGRTFRVDIDNAAASASRDANVDLEGLVSRSAEKVFRLLPHRGQVRIQVRLDAARAIPEIGVGGFTERSGDVMISIAPTPPGGLRAALRMWVPATLAHELHHSSRIRTGPGYGVTLGEALVTEGLADQFVAEVFPATPLQPWVDAFPKEREQVLWRRAQPELAIPFGYDHRSWFFGGNGLPRWAGYTLGYRIAAAYLKSGHRPSASVRVPAEKVISVYRRTAGS